MLRNSILLLVSLLLFSFTKGIAQEPQDTRVVVRAKANDAKFIGSSMGGVVVAIRDAHTGALIAQGEIKGSTGNTQQLMRTPHKRGTRLSKGGAAKFDTTLKIKKPTLATIEAKGPLGQPQSAILTSTEVWLVPGKDIDGDGVVLDFPGFAVDMVSPRAHTMVEKGEKVEIKANVVMMCGCPTKPGGLWNSDDYQIEAWIEKEGKFIDKVPLSFSGKTSYYTGLYDPKSSGSYNVTLVVFDPSTNNTGVDRSSFIYR